MSTSIFPRLFLRSANLSNSPDRKAIGWERYENRFVQPLLKRRTRVGEFDELSSYTIWTGRFWGDKDNGA